MINNFYQWYLHYEDILLQKYETFRLLFLNVGDIPPLYEEFVHYLYDNTKKFVDVTKQILVAPVY